jgi:hypothetical protein
MVDIREESVGRAGITCVLQVEGVGTVGGSIEIR